MKKIVTGILLLSYLTSNAQKEFIIYKNKLQPGHKYISETNTTTDIELHISAGKEDAGKVIGMLPPGVKLPLKVSFDNQTHLVITTQPINKDKEIPFNIYCSKSILTALMDNKTEEQNTPLYDTKIYGHSKENGKIKPDSISGKKSDKIMEGMVSDIIKNIQSDLQADTQSVKIGDSFTRKMPLNISIPQIVLPPMDVKVTYKLTDIKGDEAFFDLAETTTFNYYTKQVDANMAGRGNGKIVYNIKDGFIISVDSYLDCTFTIKSKDGKKEMSGSAKLTTKRNSSIE